MPFSMMATTNPPRSVSRTWALVPYRLVPPMTAAPTANSSVNQPPVEGEHELVRAGQQDAGDRSHRGADDEAGQLHARDVDAGPAEPLGVADGVDVTPHAVSRKVSETSSTSSTTTTTGMPLSELSCGLRGVPR